MGIITNGRKEVQIERIKKLKMDNYFSSIICAHDHPKPSYLPFKKCLEEINLQPKNIVYIGDDYKLDYLPAKEMGFEAVLLDRSKLIHENHNLLSIQNLNCFM